MIFLNRKFYRFLFPVTSIICFIAGTYLYRNKQPVDVAHGVEEKLAYEVFKLEQEGAEIIGDPENFEKWRSCSYPFFLIQDGEIVRWNNNSVLPNPPFFQEKFHFRLQQNSRGDYLLRNWSIGEHRSLIGMIPLRIQYSISNQYLVSGFRDDIFPLQAIKIDGPDSQEGKTVSIGDIPVIKLVSLQSKAVDNGSLMAWTFHMAGSIFLLLSVWIWAGIMLNRKLAWVAIVFTGLTLWVLRLFLVYGNFNGPFSSTPAFDPQQFASSSFNASIGDLFLNTLALLVFSLFIYFRCQPLRGLLIIRKGNELLRFFTGVSSLLMGLLSLLLPLLYYETVFHNSSISLDATESIQFGTVRTLAIASVLMSGLVAYLFIHIFLRIAFAATGRSFYKYLVQLLIADLILWLYHFFTDRQYEITILLGLAYFIILFVGNNIWRQRSYLAARTYWVTFLGLIVLALQGALAVKLLSTEKQMEDQVRFANSFLADRDVLAEYLLEESIKGIENDPFIRQRMASPFLSKQAVQQKVKRVYLSNYFDRFDRKVMLFQPDGRLLDNTQDSIIHYIKGFQPLAKGSDWSGIYFTNAPSAEVTRRYLVVVAIQWQRLPVGYVVIDLAQNRILPELVYPGLLVDNRFSQYFKNKSFSFAFLSSGQIATSSGSFNYERDFEIDWLGRGDLYHDGVIQSGFRHVAVEDSFGKVVIASAPAYPLFNVLTNFSIFFLAGLFLVVSSALYSGARELLEGNRLSFSNRIQLYVYLAFVFPLVVISITTLRLTANSSQKQVEQDYLEKSVRMGRPLAEIITAMNDSSSSENVEEIQASIVLQSQLAGVDASVYSTSGLLLASSQPSIFENQLISRLLNPVALHEIGKERKNSVVLNESIGLLQYKNTFIALQSPTTGDLLAILSLPFFESEYSMEKQQINILANVATVFVGIFLLFFSLSVIAVNTLTFPLRFITSVLKRTTFTGENNKLSWHAQDEIGMMVKEYNQMVDSLSKSREDLARSQRELVWREMARQVAHEIKNPLTPMKLTLQQMERNLEGGDIPRDQTSQAVKTLLNQVEILDDIVSSFSALAQMPVVKLEEIDIADLLQRSVNLFAQSDDGTIALRLSKSPVYVLGDPKLFDRIFSNLILNAFQSREGARDLHLEVNLTTDDKTVLISFADNGGGISDKDRERVFLPYYSTKKAGSGLGLAIAKHGIEQANGRIWLETREGLGTTFFISLLVAVSARK